MIGPVRGVFASLSLAAATLALAAPGLRADTLTVPGPSGFSLWAQFWHPDAGAVAGFAGSNGVCGTVP